jgi:hypothetical protein
VAKKKDNINQDKFSEIMANWDAVNDTEKDQRELAVEDSLFAHVAGAQWDDNAQKARAGKPMYEINKVAPSINLVVGTQRQNKIGMKVRPLNNGATKEIAKTFNGLHRNIENRSKFENIQNTAFKEVVTGGYGAWQLSTGYSNDQSFEQDISIQSISSACNSVYFDVGSTEDNHKDANWCFVLADIPLSEFRNKHPDAIESTLDSQNNSNYHTGWCGKDSIRIADYWCKEPKDIKLLLLSDGQTIELNDKTQKIIDELASKQITVIKERVIKSHKIVHYKISGAEILEEKKEWAGKHIPVVMTYGYNIIIDGIRYVRGIVRMAKDSQRIYNYSRSAIVEATALAKKDPTWLNAKEVAGFEGEVGKDKPIQLYNQVPDGRGPIRTGAPSIQSSLIEQANQASDDVKVTTGFFDPSLGNNPANQSGKAILAQQQQGDLGTYELTDNLVKSVEYTAELLIDLLPRIYDTPRQENIINEDGSEEIVPINTTIRDKESGKDIIVNDLSLGQYGVVASNGASYATKRTEMLNTLVSLGSNDPQFAQVSGDLLAKNLDFPFAEDLSDRLRKPMIANGIIEPNEDEIKKMQENAPQPDPTELLNKEIIKMQAEKIAVEVDNLILDGEKTKAEIAKTYADTNKSFADASKNSTRETPSEIEAQEKAADAANTIIEETFEEDEIIEQPQQLNQDGLNTNNLQNQRI